jgi:hypothetical protein
MRTPMKMKYFTSVAVLLLLAGGTIAEAQSLKIRQKQADQEKQLEENVKGTNVTCGANIVVKFDWKDAPADDLTKFSASGYCDAALAGIRHICDEETGKTAVKEKIKTMTCGFGAERSIALKDGALDYKINFNSSNDTDYVFAFLQNNL